jgi:uncharacterized protein
MSASSPPDAAGLLDWRRQVFALYAQVRETARVDPAEAHRCWRAGRDDLFATHVQSPLLPAARESFAGLPVAPYDPSLRREARLEPADEPSDEDPGRLEVPTGTDGVVPFDRAGRLVLDGLGSLDVWWLGSYGGGLFVPVKDALAGPRTYGGGRYLLDTVKGADLGSPADDPRTLVVDLNFAYNPSCAYDPAWACPLAPLGNTLDVEVFAGELMPEQSWM